MKPVKHLSTSFWRVLLGRADKGLMANLQVMRRYHIQDREDYKKYNKLSGMITKLTHLLRQLDAQDTDRIQMTEELLTKCAPL